MRKALILVVDDDPGILSSLELLLQDEGYYVQTSIKDGEFIDEVMRASHRNGLSSTFCCRGTMDS